MWFRCASIPACLSSSCVNECTRSRTFPLPEYDRSNATCADRICASPIGASSLFCCVAGFAIIIVMLISWKSSIFFVSVLICIVSHWVSEVAKAVLQLPFRGSCQTASLEMYPNSSQQRVNDSMNMSAIESLPSKKRILQHSMVRLNAGVGVRVNFTVVYCQISKVRHPVIVQVLNEFRLCIFPALQMCYAWIECMHILRIHNFRYKCF